MLLLTSVDTDDEVSELVQRFEASGIPIFVEPDYTRTDPSNRGATFGYRIHVWLEEQLGEAKKLLSDPSYEVVEPVDVGAFYAALEEHDKDKEAEWRATETRWLNWLAVILAVGVAAWIVFAVLAE